MVNIDTSTWTRMAEVEAHAAKHGLSVQDAIRNLVNHALSTPPPTTESYENAVAAGAQALIAAFPTLTDDFTYEWFRKAAQIVLDA